MHKPALRRVALPVLGLVLALPSCMLGSYGAPGPVPAGLLFRGDYVNVRVPNSDGWHLVSAGTEGMEFARLGAEPGESFAAQVFMFPLPDVQDDQDFLAFVEQQVADNEESERFSAAKSELQVSNERSYPCVRVVTVMQDHEAQTAPDRQETLLLQGYSLFCRHPVRQDTFFVLVYSHRGKTEYPDLLAEAEDFFEGVQVPGH